MQRHPAGPERVILDFRFSFPPSPFRPETKHWPVHEQTLRDPRIRPVKRQKPRSKQLAHCEEIKTQRRTQDRLLGGKHLVNSIRHGVTRHQEHDPAEDAPDRCDVWDVSVFARGEVCLLYVLFSLAHCRLAVSSFFFSPDDSLSSRDPLLGWPCGMMIDSGNPAHDTAPRII